MSKLLAEPRVKDITEPKKKKRVITPRPVSDVPVKYTLLHESDKAAVDELFKIYQKDKYMARVKYFNSNRGVCFYRLVVFERGNDFEICYFQNSFGISVTNKMYSSQKKLSSIIYKNGKFWYTDSNRKVVNPLVWGNVLGFINHAENLNYWMREDLEYFYKSKTIQYLYAKFPWLLVVAEHPNGGALNLNVIKDKKLFGLKDITRHMMKVPNNVSKVLMSSKFYDKLKHGHQKVMTIWKETLKVLDNVNHLSIEMLDHPLFEDTCKMARTLGKKVNCKWGPTRLNQEHDDWSKQITAIILDCEDEYVLSIRPEFLAFAEFSGYQLMRTNKDMILEGMKQNHCVGTYIDRVNKGECAIFHVDGYTLQVGIEKTKQEFREQSTTLDGVNPLVVEDSGIRIPQARMIDVKSFKNMQFRGRHNQQAPTELMDKVQLEMEKFKAAGKFNEVPDGYTPSNRKSSVSWDVYRRQVVENDPMPF